MGSGAWVTLILPFTRHIFKLYTQASASLIIDSNNNSTYYLLLSWEIILILYTGAYLSWEHILSIIDICMYKFTVVCFFFLIMSCRTSTGTLI